MTKFSNLRRLMAYVLIVAAFVAAVFPLVSPPVLAQITLTSTTTSAAMTADIDRVPLASQTGVSVGTLLYIDREAMEVIELINSTFVRVRRGVAGSQAGPHASGAVVYAGAPSSFGHVSPAGPCTATAEVALPRINVATGDVFQCSAGQWRVYRRAGVRNYDDGLGNNGSDYTAAGAITIEPGVVFLNAGSALAMTLANPSTDQNGMRMCIITKTAQAHTVTYTAGFGGGTTARDVATFTAAINNGFCIVASAGVWYPIPTVAGVAFG